MKYIVLILELLFVQSIAYCQSVEKLKTQLYGFWWGQFQSYDSLSNPVIATDSNFFSLIQFNTNGCKNENSCALYRSQQVQLLDPVSEEIIFESVSCQPNYFFCSYKDNKYKFHTADESGIGISYISIADDTLTITIYRDEGELNVERFIKIQ